MNLNTTTQNQKFIRYHHQDTTKVPCISLSSGILSRNFMTIYQRREERRCNIAYWSPNISDIGPSSTSFRTSNSTAIQGAWRNHGRSLSLRLIRPFGESGHTSKAYTFSRTALQGAWIPQAVWYTKNSSVLRELHREGYAVRHLAIKVEFGAIPWTKIAPEFRKIFELLRATSRHLVSLANQNVISLPPFIVTGPPLKELHLENQVGFGLPVDLTALLPYPPLREGFFNNHSHTFYHSPSALRLSKLKKLEAINLQPQDFPQIWNTLCSASDTLEYISIVQGCKEIYHPFPLQDAKRL